MVLNFIGTLYFRNKITKFIPLNYQLLKNEKGSQLNFSEMQEVLMWFTLLFLCRDKIVQLQCTTTCAVPLMGSYKP